MVTCDDIIALSNQREVQKMNGFTMLAESYRKAVEQGKIDKQTADKETRILDFLATCDTDDFCRLFDSSAFNEITKSYVRKAVAELTDEGTLDDEQAVAVRNRVSLLFDERTAKEVL